MAPPPRTPFVAATREVSAGGGGRDAGPPTLRPDRTRGDLVTEEFAGVTIRLADVADAPWLAALAERTFRETYSAFNTPEDMERYVAEHFGPARQAAELRDPAMATLVADVEGRPAGYVQLAPGGAPAGVGEAPIEIHRFYVDRSWHGRGVAQQLMDAAADAARARGGRTLWLGVWERN